MITFDGEQRLVYLDAAQHSYSDVEIYSRWLEWVHSGAGALYPEAFIQEGGLPIAGGSTELYTILQNQAGYDWRIQQPDTNEDYLIGGNLIVSDPESALFVRPTGFNPFVQIRLTGIAVAGAVLTERQAMIMERLYYAHYFTREHDDVTDITTVHGNNGQTFDFDDPADGSLVSPRFDPNV